MSKLVSVILPAFNERDAIAPAVSRIRAVLDGAGIDFELVFVNDGSRDGTWQAVCDAAQGDSRVRGVSFSRNFGKEAALFAGLAEAEGDCCVTLDCDLQHPPEYIPQMVQLWQEGAEVVEAVKADRGRESGVYRFCAKCFYGLISSASGIDMAKSSDFKLLDRKAVDALLELPERNTFYRALSSWVGFRTAQVPFQVEARAQGESKWSVLSLVKYAVNSITSFSTAPMQFVTWLGVLTLLVSAVMGVQTLAKKFMGRALEGFTTVIVVQLFIGGVIMMSLGIIGHYIAKIYDEIKRRPRFIVSERCGKREGTCRSPSSDRT